jgi:hypothetical protein
VGAELFNADRQTWQLIVTETLSFFKLCPLSKLKFSKPALLPALGGEAPNLVDPLRLSYSESSGATEALVLLRYVRTDQVHG